MQIGAQLWIFSHILDESAMDGILAQLAGAGYTHVEAMYGKPPSTRITLDHLGLPCYALHIALSAMPTPAQLIHDAHQMGARVVCASGLLRWEERAPDDYRRAASALNAWGHLLAREGIALHYHNHEFEFAPVEGARMGMDILLDGLDPTAALLCCDMGWIAVAGYDPAAFIRAHVDRIGTLHLRDFKGKGSVALGEGDIDLSSVTALIDGLPNLQAVLVEQDPTTATPLDDMIRSRRWLRMNHGM